MRYASGGLVKLISSPQQAGVKSTAHRPPKSLVVTRLFGGRWAANKNTGQKTNWAKDYMGKGAAERSATVRIYRLICRPPETAAWRLVKTIKHKTPRSGPKAMEQSKRNCQYWEELRCQC